MSDQAFSRGGKHLLGGGGSASNQLLPVTPVPACSANHGAEETTRKISAWECALPPLGSACLWRVLSAREIVPCSGHADDRPTSRPPFSASGNVPQGHLYSAK